MPPTVRLKLKQARDKMEYAQVIAEYFRSQPYYNSLKSVKRDPRDITEIFDGKLL